MSREAMTTAASEAAAVAEPRLASEARWVVEPPPIEVEAQLMKLRRADDVRRIAVMPDVHLGSEACVGSVIATSRLLYPSAVGGDLGCGMAAMRFTCAAEQLADRDRAARLLHALARAVPAMTRPRAQPVAGGAQPADVAELIRELEATPLTTAALESFRRRTAWAQLGTLGSGNHFIELQADEQGQLWMMLHSGSRGIGQEILASHLVRAPRGATGLPFLDAERDEGRRYLADLRWGLRYAEANRRALAQRTAEIVEDVLATSRDETSYLACHHNYIEREVHEGGELWVHRKGAISARRGELGIIPGSMGSPSYHVEGRGHAAALCSSSHGAGRRMSRGEARRKISRRTLEAEMKSVWFDHRHAEQLRDEAPSAYKDIGAVMRAQRELTRIVRRLHPLLSYKGS
jgi:tRNA-splicing ligase RtcB (3'-phosphate/5'-hydroxy nucleic acid ligase)